MGQSQPLFVYFCLFYMTQIKYKLVKVLMVCLGLKPGVAGWKVKTNPLSYGCTLILLHGLGSFGRMPLHQMHKIARQRSKQIDCSLKQMVHSFIEKLFNENPPCEYIYLKLPDCTMQQIKNSIRR